MRHDQHMLLGILLGTSLTACSTTPSSNKDFLEMVETARSIFARADIKLTIDEISSIPKKHRRPSLAKIDQLTGLTSGSTSNGQLNVFVVDKLTDNPDLLSDTDIADELNLMNKAPFAFGSLPTLTPQQVQILRLSPLVTNNGVR